MKEWPTTVFGVMARYNQITSVSASGYDSSLTWHFVLLVIGTLYNPDQEYFYDNVWADLVLNSGEPTDVYSWVDLFTWRGWLETALTIAVTTFITNLIVGFVGVATYVTFYAMVPESQYKLCEGKEIAWGIQNVYMYYPCEEWDFLTKF